MKQEQTSRRGICAALMSVLLCAAILFSTLLAVSPSLHQLLHQDANQASHECVVTMMQKQQLSSDAPAPLLVGFISRISFTPDLGPTVALSQIDHPLASSRGPPAILL